MIIALVFGFSRGHMAHGKFLKSIGLNFSKSWLGIPGEKITRNGES